MLKAAVGRHLPAQNEAVSLGTAYMQCRWPDAVAHEDKHNSMPESGSEAFLELERIHGFTGKAPAEISARCSLALGEGHRWAVA